MIYSITITQRGQITIPKIMREALKLKAGQRLYFELVKDKAGKMVKIFPNILRLAESRKEPGEIVKSQ